MSSSRERILNRLRAAGESFPDAPPRPAAYLPVTRLDDATPAGLLARFTAEAERLSCQVSVVDGDDAARACVLDILRAGEVTHLLAWDFAHIPVSDLQAAVRAAGIAVTFPDVRDEFRAETLAHIEPAQAGLTGADAAAAATGTLVVSSGPGRGRIPTILPPLHVVVIEQRQLVPRIEDWVAGERAAGLAGIRASANLCIISGPSRTADIEKNLVLGMHGPGALHIVIKR
jgi:L-lactate utilization protein LutC